ncbi:gem-associated protein 7 isoform X3 [Cricetulus griseus]|uniref:Gem-associated protein 7 n=1 Tax=Cricetulus griseus TaxID=10029 RepID=A0A9J7H7M4_CRIGR|nr:gem-associated protein 7 isoform X3 [Cricetulus griseus]XP_035305215.1 gem-associated protein 7 isoform X3 [Cricetulus griseus]
MTMTSVHPRCPLPGWQSPGPARRPTSDQRTRGGSGRRRNPGVRGSVPTRTHVATAPAERRRSGLGAFAGTCAAAAAAVAARAEVTELATTTWVAWAMQTPRTIPVPVPVLRLPRGPDGFSRGFAPDGRRALLRPKATEVGEGTQDPPEFQEQRARAALRERYLRSLLAMVGHPVSFTLHEGVHVTAQFGATDLDVANFYVSQLQTPIGVQAEALLRCSDIISYSFKL